MAGGGNRRETTGVGKDTQLWLIFPHNKNILLNVCIPFPFSVAKYECNIMEFLMRLELISSQMLFLNADHHDVTYVPT